MTLATPPSDPQAPARPGPRGSRTVGLLVALNVLLLAAVVVTLLTTSALYALVAEQERRPSPYPDDVAITVLPWSNDTRLIRVLSTPPSAIAVGHFTFLVVNYEGHTLLRGPPGTSVEVNGTTIAVLFDDRDASGSVTAGDTMTLQLRPMSNRSIVYGGRWGLYDDLGIPRASFSL